MTRRHRKLSCLAALGVLFVAAESPVSAQRPAAETIGATHGQIVGVAAWLAGAGALNGIGIYAAVKHNHSITGCAHSGPHGLTLMSEPDKETFALIGEVSGIKAGDRVRVSGKKEKSAAKPQFLVEKVSNDFGPCEVAGASR